MLHKKIQGELQCRYQSFLNSKSLPNIFWKWKSYDRIQIHVCCVTCEMAINNRLMIIENYTNRLIEMQILHFIECLISSTEKIMEGGRGWLRGLVSVTLFLSLGLTVRTTSRYAHARCFIMTGTRKKIQSDIYSFIAISTSLYKGTQRL